jgi:hypothetical protein
MLARIIERAAAIKAGRAAAPTPATATITKVAKTTKITKKPQARGMRATKKKTGVKR